jgi:hypothetical protein
MNEDKLISAIDEAERFLSAAKENLDSMSGRYYTPGKLSGATKRASMDLTRSLADLRRPG